MCCKNQSWLLLILLLGILSGCGEGQAEDPSSYRIKGRFDSQGLVELFRLSFPDQFRTLETRIDTIRTKPDGSFVLQGKLRTPDSEHIGLLRRDGESILFILKPGNWLIGDVEADLPSRIPLTALELAHRRQQERESSLENAIGAAVQAADWSLRDSIRTLWSQDRVAYYAGLERELGSARHPLEKFYVTELLSWQRSFEEIRDFSNSMLLTYRQSPYTRDLSARVAAWEEILVSSANELLGKPAPAVALADPGGRTRRLSDLRGDVVLLDFWASWCRPCRQENPNLVSTYERYKDLGFSVFSVSIDRDPSAWKQAIRDDGLNWPDHVLGESEFSSEAAAAYSVSSIPAGFLIDRAGNVVASGVELRAERLSETVSHFLTVPLEGSD